MKKLLSVFVMVALLLTSLCPAFLVSAADNLTGGIETHNYDVFTLYMDEVSVYEGETKADAGLYWAGNTAEANPNDIMGLELFVYYPKTLTFTGFKTSEDFPLGKGGAWENSDTESVLNQETVSRFPNAEDAFAACGVEVPAGAESDYRFVKLILDRDIEDPAYYNGLLGTLSFDIAADAEIGTYEIGLVTDTALIASLNPLEDIFADLVNGSVTVAAKPIAAATVSVGAETCKTGGEVTVPVKLDSNSGIFIARMSLDYNRDIFTVKEITAGDVFTEPNHFLSSVDANGDIMLYFEAGADADVTATGTLAYVTFTVANADKVAGAYTITPTYLEIMNYAEEDVSATMVPGTVTVEVSETLKVEAAEVSGPLFQEVKVPVYVGRNAEGIWAIRAEFAYDQSALKFEGVEDGLFSVADGYSESDGIITVFIEKETLQNVTETEGVLYTLKFTALTEGITPIHADVKEVINLDEQYVDFLSIGGSVNVTPCEHVHGTYDEVTKKPTMYEDGVLSTLCTDCDAELSTAPIAKVAGLSPEKTEGPAGGQVKVPVNLLNNPGLVSVGAEFVYDPTQMTFKGLESGLFNTDEFSVSDKNGTVTIFVESPAIENITEDGVAFYMLFDIPEGAAPLAEYVFTGKAIDQYNVNVDEEYVYMEVDSGTVMVACPHADKLDAETVPPTCTEPGMIVIKCALCGEVVESEVDPEHPEALGHEEGEGVVTKEATCKEEGIMTYYCVRCDIELRTESIEKLAHVEGAGVVTKEATCKEAGEMTYYCTVCGDVLRTEVIVRLAHTENAGVVTKEATCTEEGEMTYSCTVCGNVLRTEPIAKLNHTEGEGVVTKEATCTEEGEMTYSCTVCGNVLRTEPIAKLDHTEGEGVVAKEATCTEEGEITYTCAVCGTVLRTEKIEKLSHTAGEWVVVKEPTETEAGLKTQSCAVCGNELQNEVIPATGTDTTDSDPSDTTVSDVTTGNDTTKVPVDSTTTSSDDKNPPKTGDYMVYIIIVTAVAVVGCVVVFAIRKKKASEK